MPDSYIQIPTYDPADPNQPVIESPAAGMIRFNLDTDTLEVYNGTEWVDSSAITSKYIQIPAARNPDQYPRNPPTGSMVFNESTQKVDVYNGRDWRPGVNVPLMRRIYDLPDMFPRNNAGTLIREPIQPDGDDVMIIDQMIGYQAGPPAQPAVNKTFKITLDDFYHGEFFSGIFDEYFASKTTDDLREGETNLYFTQARARASISLDTSQDYFGFLFYDQSTGVIRYQGTTEDDVRSSLSLEYGDLANYDSSTGVFTFPGEFDDPYFNSVRVNTVYTDHIIYTGSGPVRLDSGSDLRLNADGYIFLDSPVVLPNRTVEQLLDMRLEARIGMVVYCTDPEIGGPRPVIWNGNAWKDFLNGDIYDIYDF